jgi:hypothetical protein
MLRPPAPDVYALSNLLLPIVDRLIGIYVGQVMSTSAESDKLVQERLEIA